MCTRIPKLNKESLKNKEILAYFFFVGYVIVSFTFFIQLHALKKFEDTWYFLERL